MNKIVTKATGDGLTTHKGRTVAGMMTMEQVDEEGEVIIASGIDTSYMEKAGALLFNHDSNKPIGKVRRIQPKTDASGKVVGLYGSCHLAETALAEDCLRLADIGALHFSIGFVRTDAGAPTSDEAKAFPGASYITRACRMHELSLTPIPANIGAIVDSVQKGLVHQSTADALVTKSPKILSIDEPTLGIMFTLDI